MKNFVKLFFIFMLFSLIISGCVVAVDPDDIFLYDFGLTGIWDLLGSSNTLTIENLTGYTITSGKYYSTGITEPDWSLITENLNFEETPLLSTDPPRVLTIGTAATDIIIPAGGSATIWVKINSGSDYLVGAFEYKASANAWTLTVYTKQ